MRPLPVTISETNVILEDMQRFANHHRHEQAQIAVMQRALATPQRRAPAPPIPMAPLTHESITETILDLSPLVLKLFYVLSTMNKKNGIVNVSRDELSRVARLSPASITRATRTLQSNGLVQRIGKFGYVLRRKDAERPSPDQ